MNSNDRASKANTDQNSEVMTPPPLLSRHAPPQSIGGSAKEAMAEKHGKFVKRITLPLAYSQKGESHDSQAGGRVNSAFMPNCKKKGGGMKLPQWIIDEVRKNKKDLRHLNSLNTIKDIARFNLHTVCDEALCPNKGKCFSDGGATFLILGDICTRKCKFCAVKKKEEPLAPNAAEPKNIAILSKKWNLKYVVFTAPTRDDLSDGGAAQFAQTVIEIKKISRKIKTEPLIPDFGGNIKSLETVLNSNPDVLAHNIETVPSLYERIRIGSNYKKSLQIIKNSKKINPAILTKSGLMLGLGETEKELEETFADLLRHNCELLTLGQYIAPSKKHYPVKKYLHPEEFIKLRKTAEKMGFKAVLSGPLVRSSYRADYLYEKGFGARSAEVADNRSRATGNRLQEQSPIRGQGE